MVLQVVINMYSVDLVCVLCYIHGWKGPRYCVGIDVLKTESMIKTRGIIDMEKCMNNVLNRFQLQNANLICKIVV